ncbi:DUF805 domain-containing protein [Limibaculum sp. FT325]|uniref:DUF805 domain-containing protein n=1 Tax=Thermohalobaculum sediminis TaxID=2939436 RepID=UPI0020BD49A9|nr:DUF805 domain-containing protein [Limibaculum sediminis]MCL5777639.1 DUF805 domain-containing protein [Limibaculum sediminis]
MGPVEAIQSVVRNYANFAGRATRPEYWWWALFQVVSSVVLGQIPVLGQLWSLVILLPSLAVGVRRLHDVGRSGWLILLPWAGLPFVLLGGAIQGGILEPVGYVVIFCGALAVLVWACMDGTPGPNGYGPDPKGRGGRR